MECINCNSDRILIISAKCASLCFLQFKEVEHQGEIPSDLTIGGGDYIELDICLECGMAQGMSDEPDPKFYKKGK